MRASTDNQTVPALVDVLAKVPDHRSRQGQRHPLAALLAAAVTAMLAGCRGPVAVAQWTRAHESAARLLGFVDRRLPCASTYHYVFRDLDVEAFEAVLTKWLVALAGGDMAGEAIRVDGKVLRGSKRGELPGVCIVSAYADGLQSAIAQVEVATKTNEHKAALELLHIIPLEGVVISGDAAFTQRDFCETVLEGGGDYYLRVKDNQPTLLHDIQDAFAGGFSPLGTESA